MRQLESNALSGREDKGEVQMENEKDSFSFEHDFFQEKESVQLNGMCGRYMQEKNRTLKKVTKASRAQSLSTDVCHKKKETGKITLCRVSSIG